MEVIFERAVEGTEYVFQGEYLCWLNREHKYIKAIDLTKKDQDRKIKKISFAEYMTRNVDSNEISISECEPYGAIRATQFKLIDEDAIRKVANCV